MFLHLIDRNTARAHGLKRFYTGRPCRRGGLAQRMTGNGTCCCVECLFVKSQNHLLYRMGESREKLLAAKRAEYKVNAEKYCAEKKAKRAADPVTTRAADKARRESNLEKCRLQSRESHARNRDKRIAYMRERRSKNPEYYREKLRQYAKQNPEKYRANNERRRGLERERLPTWYGEFDHFAFGEAAMLTKDRFAATGLRWHVDHMIPLKAKTASGLHCAHNFQVIPAYLNKSKRNYMRLTEPDEWIAHL